MPRLLRGSLQKRLRHTPCWKRRSHHMTSPDLSLLQMFGFVVTCVSVKTWLVMQLIKMVPCPRLSTRKLLLCGFARLSTSKRPQLQWCLKFKACWLTQDITRVVVFKTYFIITSEGRLDYPSFKFSTSMLMRDVVICMHNVWYLYTLIYIFNICIYIFIYIYTFIVISNYIEKDCFMGIFQTICWFFGRVLEPRVSSCNIIIIKKSEVILCMVQARHQGETAMHRGETSEKEVIHEGFAWQLKHSSTYGRQPKCCVRQPNLFEDNPYASICWIFSHARQPAAE